MDNESLVNLDSVSATANTIPTKEHLAGTRLQFASQDCCSECKGTGVNFNPVNSNPVSDIS